MTILMMIMFYDKTIFLSLTELLHIDVFISQITSLYLPKFESFIYIFDRFAL